MIIKKRDVFSGVKIWSMRYFEDYLTSFKSFKSYKWKLLWMILIDIAYLFLFYVILSIGYSVVTTQYLNEITPLAQKAGLAKEMESAKELKALAATLFSEEGQSKSISMKDIKTKVFFILSMFVGKILLGLFLLIVLTSITRVLVWSFVKNNFKRFYRFVIYNFVWIIISILLFILSWILLKKELFIKIGPVIILMYYYFSIILRVKYDNESPLFKQIYTNCWFGIKYFIVYIGVFLLMLFTFAIIYILSGLWSYIFPQLVSGTIVIITFIVFVTWCRIYLHVATQNRINNNI